MFNKEISVIIPIYNSERFLETTLNSVKNQTFADFEVILVDDGSTDNSYEICKKFAEKDSRFLIHRKSNSGVADARNTGLSLTSGRYISFLDSDDTYEKDFLQILYDLINIYHSDVAASNIMIRTPGESAIRSYSQLEGNKLFSGNEFYLLQTELIACSLWNKLFKRKIFDNVRFPSGMLFEDNYVFHDLYKESTKIIFTSECLYNYIKRNNSITTSAFSFKKYKDHIDGLYRRLNYFLDTGQTLAASQTRNMLIDYIAGVYGKDQNVLTDKLTNIIIRDHLLYSKVYWKTKILLALKYIK